jgi:chromosome segregation ATPase
LHEATSQVDQANTECVQQVKEIDSLTKDKEEAQTKMLNLQRENAALKRRLESLDPAVVQAKLPRPGPSLKPFEDLTPRQKKVASSRLQKQVTQTSEERRIHPVKLSAYLTFR